MVFDFLVQVGDAGTLINTYYHDWALMAVLLTVLLAVGPAVLWLLHERTGKAEEAYLSIRAGLVGRFHAAVLGQTRTLLREVDDLLPYELAHPDRIRGRSRFDHLSGALASIASEHDEDDNDDHEGLRVLLREALAGVIATQANNLISRLEETLAAGTVDESQSLLQMGGLGPAMDALGNLSVEYRQVRRRRACFRWGRKVAVWMAIGGGLAFGVAFVGAFFNSALGQALTQWALQGYAIFVLLSLMAGFLAGYFGLYWLQEKARQDG